ncbi:hypothetical protein Fmac_004826 [Flemingia macrophylla]|uniref:Uncharacterized protein n=1 Tax=Flemingia macrophylla TaxID=520843 RepID=A0ABD1N606_9FABA
MIVCREFVFSTCCFARWWRVIDLHARGSISKKIDECMLVVSVMWMLTCVFVYFNVDFVKYEYLCFSKPKNF